MKRMSHSILALLLTLLPAAALADGVTCLVVDLADGSQTVVPLADSPVVTCQGGALKVVAAGKEKMSAPLGDVVQYAFSAGLPTSMKGLGGERARLEQGHVYMAGVRAGETVAAYQAGGQMVMQVRVGEDGLADVDLSALPKGIYVVKSSKTSIKVINK